MSSIGKLEEKDYVVPLTLPERAIPLEMVWIAPGSFMMGLLPTDPHFSDEDDPPFEVHMTKGFWISRFLITQAQWMSVMQTNPSQFQTHNDAPVESISWYYAMEFCSRLSISDDDLYGRNYRFRLPSEAQWEYSCRAGASTRYNSGNSVEDLSKVAWHLENSGGTTHRVGEKDPNGWGLYDMYGNVFEWCYDTPVPYPKKPTNNWINHGHGYIRTCRGGSFGTPSDAAEFNPGARGIIEPDEPLAFLGFRVVLSKMTSEDMI